MKVTILALLSLGQAAFALAQTQSTLDSQFILIQSKQSQGYLYSGYGLRFDSDVTDESIPFEARYTNHQRNEVNCHRGIYDPEGVDNRKLAFAAFDFVLQGSFYNSIKGDGQEKSGTPYPTLGAAVTWCTKRSNYWTLEAGTSPEDKRGEFPDRVSYLRGRYLRKYSYGWLEIDLRGDHVRRSGIVDESYSAAVGYLGEYKRSLWGTNFLVRRTADAEYAPAISVQGSQRVQKVFLNALFEKGLSANDNGRYIEFGVQIPF